MARTPLLLLVASLAVLTACSVDRDPVADEPEPAATAQETTPGATAGPETTTSTTPEPASEAPTSRTPTESTPQDTSGGPTPGADVAEGFVLEGDPAPSDAPGPETTSNLVPVPQNDAAAPPASAGGGAQYTPEEFYQDYAVAMQVVNGFWTNHWSDSLTGTYTPPSFVTGSQYGAGMYLGGTDQVVCGNAERAIYLQADNAYYCGLPYDPDDDYLAFDVNFLWKARENGDMFVYMIVAHEWAHAIQARLDTSLQRVEYELQADCLAGAALQGAVNDGTLVLDEGDIEEVSIGLTDVADESPWGKAGDHGDAAQRIEYFTTGANGGVLACLNTSQTQG